MEKMVWLRFNYKHCTLMCNWIKNPVLNHFELYLSLLLYFPLLCGFLVNQETDHTLFSWHQFHNNFLTFFITFLKWRDLIAIGMSISKEIQWKESNPLSHNCSHNHKSLRCRKRRNVLRSRILKALQHVCIATLYGPHGHTYLGGMCTIYLSI